MYHGSSFSLLADYNQWMNEKIYAVCAGLSDEDRKQDRGAFFKSIHGTLDHILWGDRIWLARLTDMPPPEAAIGELQHDDFNALAAARKRTDEDLIAWAKSLQQDWLDSPFEFVSTIDGKRRVLPSWVTVAQVFNHQTHHRGQVTTLLSQLGHDVGSTDIPWLPALYASSDVPAG